jgi:thiol-disulfide isomerase/thioredoxin
MNRPTRMRAALAVLFLCSVTSPALAVKPGDRAPEIDLPSLSGKRVKLSSLRGSVVVVDFWASWCVPCRKELPALDALAKRYADDRQPVVFLAVGIDKERANAEKQIAASKVTRLEVLLDPDGKTAAAYDIPTMPSSFIIDAKGLVKHMHAGYQSGDEKKLAAEIDALLGR